MRQAALSQVHVALDLALGHGKGECRACWPARFIAVLLTLLALGAFAVSPACAEEFRKPRRVLILHAYHKGFSWTDNLQTGIEAGLSRAGDLRNETNVEYLDTKAHALSSIYTQLKALFATKYASARPDVIITSDDNALDFMLAVTEEVFPGVPVVFCGVNVFNDTRLQGRANFTGVLEDYDITGTLDLIRKLHPGMKTLAVVSDSTETGGINLARFRKEAPGRLGGIDVRELSDLTSDELREALGGLPRDTIILNLSFFRDRDGRSFSPKEGGAFIAQASGRPIYSCWDFFMEGDVVGGRVVSGYAQGLEAAAIALKVLRGTPPSSIPVLRESPNQFLFDYGPLVRAGLSKADLPQGSVVIREPDTLYSRFKRELTYLAVVLAVLLFAVVVLAMNIAHRRRIQGTLRSLVEEHQTIFDNSQVGILHLKGGRVVYRANKRAADILGYASPEALAGLDLREFHQSRESFDGFGASHYDKLKSGTRLHVEWPLKRKNGELFLAQLSGKAVDPSVLPDLDKGVIWIVDDISERKKAEDALRKSEERMRLFFERQIIGAAITTPAKGWARVNARLCQMLGYTAEEFMALTWAELTYPDDLAPDLELFNRMLAGEIDDYIMEKRFLHKDGSILFTNLAVACVRKPGGEVDYVQALLEDITARKTAETALRASEEQFRSIVETSPMGMHFYHLEGGGRLTLVAANAASDRILGIRHSELIGLTIDEAFPGLAGTAITDMYRRIASGQLGIQTFETPYADGNVSGCYEVYAFRIGENSMATHFVDITERRRMQDVIIQTEKMMSVGGLAAGMAHEINNPLGGILQSVQVLTRRLSEDLAANRLAADKVGCSFDSIRQFMERRSVFELLEGIHEAGRRATEIVASMLEFSRKSASGHTPADLNALLDKSLELCATDYDLKKSYDFRNIRVVREFAIGLPLVPCMQTQLQQVFMNLLANAAQAMMDTSSPAIVLRTASEGCCARIEIEDNGPGMPEEVRKHIFEPFFTTKPVGEGTGLGLSVSFFIIVSHHHGTIEVESSPGQGARFIIRLPFVLPS